jgi:hypothetical protein
MLQSPRRKECGMLLFCHVASVTVTAFVSAPPKRPCHHVHSHDGATTYQFWHVSISRSSTFLCANTNNTTDVSKFDWLLEISDPRLLVGDMISIALAAQLLGLVDVLNDPTFLQRGGWFQPISPVESTLPVLVQRDSMLSICWILSALGWKGYEYTSNVGGGVGKTTLRIAAGFVGLCFLFDLVMSYVGQVSFDAWETIRQCYFALLLVGSFRFIYSQYNR